MSSSVLLGGLAGAIFITVLYNKNNDKSYDPKNKADPGAGTELLAGQNVKRCIKYNPQTCYVDNKQVSYWTPVHAVSKPKERKFDYFLNGGVRATVYADGPFPPPLYP